jgi:uncharacterized protein
LAALKATAAPKANSYKISDWVDVMAGQLAEIIDVRSSLGRDLTGLESASSTSVLVVPGWNSSGEGHWQTIWEKEFPNFRRVEQENWSEPNCRQWIERIEADVSISDSPVVFLAHSLGCLAVAHWAVVSGQAERVAGAFLVAPPWITINNPCTAPLSDFLPMPTERLPFASVLVASQNDVYLSIDRAAFLAECWGAKLVNIGYSGHINVASGQGEWPQGRRLFAEFMSQTFPRRAFRS